MGKFEVFCDKYLSQFTHKMGDLKSVGLEKEIIATDAEGYMADIAASVWPHLISKGYKPVYDSFYKDQVVAFWDGGDQIALDAGRGTFEIIMQPFESVHKAEQRMKEILSIILPVCEKEKIKILGLSYQPRSKPAKENWNKKQRYDVLLDHFGKQVWAASLSASDQVHVDVSKDEIVPVINMMNGMAGFFIVLFANCPVSNGEEIFKAYREVIWDELGIDRTGLPLVPVVSLEDYLARTWDLNCLMAYDGEKYFSPNMKFKDYVEDFDDHELFEAYKVHEGTIWFCARPRVYGTIEMRPAGLQPWDDMVAVSALTLGLMENLSESEMFVKEFRWDTLRALRLEAVKRGFEVSLHGAPVAEFVEEVIDIAKKGLKKRNKGEEIFLDPLYERVRKQEAPVDAARKYLREGGMELLLQKTSLKEEHLII